MLAGLLSGEVIASWCAPVSGPDGWQPTLEARRVGSDVVVRGEGRLVESAQQADYFLATCRDEAGVTQVLAPAATAGVTRAAMRTADLTRRFGIVRFDDATLPLDAVVGGVGRGGRRRRSPVPAVPGHAQRGVGGAMQTGFDMTVEWAFDRYTFGRPLASYQALKHRFADMMMWLEASHAISDAACVATADGAEDAAELVSAAKAYIGQYGTELLQDCVQMHGGIGVTFEHDLHLYLATLYGRPGAGRDTGRPSPTDRCARAGAGRRCGMSALPAAAVEGTDEVEDLESFRQRARSFIRDNLRRITPEEQRWAWTSGNEEAELAGIARERVIQRMLFDAGLAGICFPRPYGGQGLTPAHQRVLNEELVGHEYPAKLQVPTLSPCAAVLLDFGTEEQKLRHLPAILRGEELWMQFLSEPSGGSDVAGALTTAVRDGDQWVLNGSKVWTSGAWWSDWGLCLARTNWDVPKHRGLTVFMLPIHQPGVEVHRIEMLNGSREFCQEFMTDVIVPDSDRVGEVDDGWTVGTRWMFHERMLFTSPYVTEPVGSTHGRSDTAAVIAIAREHGLMDDPTVRDRVGEARMLELVGQELMKRVSETIRSGRMSEQVAAVGRLFKGTMQARIATLAFEVAGAEGAAWTDGSAASLERGQLPHAPGGEHRRRDGGDGAQRDQRAGARHAPRAHPGPRRPVP